MLGLAFVSLLLGGLGVGISVLAFSFFKQWRPMTHRARRVRAR